MEIRKFRKAYDLELIPASHSGIATGDLVWDPLFGPPQFSRKGMPDTIFTAFLDAGLIAEEEWKSLVEESKSAELQQAQFAARTVDLDTEYVADLKHPAIGKIQTEFLYEKLSKFSFSNLMVRDMDGLLRVRIDQLLELMRASRWNDYDGKIRRVFMITELYYGSIELVVEQQYSGELEAILNRSGLEAAGRGEGSRSVSYAFSHDQVPFAMRIERIRTFNG